MAKGVALSLLLLAFDVAAAETGTLAGGKRASMTGQAALVPPLAKRADVVQWSLLAKVTRKVVNGREIPTFTPALQRLANKKQLLQGYMVPLDAGEMQRHFLLSPAATNCPDDPESLVYVRMKEPIKFRMAPIVVSGVLGVGLNENTGMYYRVNEAIEAR